MIASLVFYSFLGSLIGAPRAPRPTAAPAEPAPRPPLTPPPSSNRRRAGSHLLGAFVAGMCFVNVPRSHQVWVAQLKRIIRWLIRIFFSATVGFAVPLSQMFTLDAFLRGLVIGVGPGQGSG